jgi:GT2 family glycosyltransferase
MKKVSIITVNFNQPLVTEALLTSIKAVETYPTIEIIVVDNGSKADPVPAWRVKYPAIKFIRSQANLGFAGGNNLGVAQATGDYLFFVNNDTEFTAGLTQGLVDTLQQHPEVGIISPKIRYFDKPTVLQYAGFTAMNYHTARNKCIGQFEEDKGQYDTITGPTGYIHGAAMMTTKEVVGKAGLMPESFFLYYEEIDWCERIKKAGYTIWVDTKTLIYHKESVSVGANSPMKEFFMNRNRILFIRRNCSFGVRTLFWVYFLAVVTPRNIIGYIRQGRWGFISILFRAIFWNFTHKTNSADLGYKLN